MVGNEKRCNFKFAMSNPKVHLLEENSLDKLIVSFGSGPELVIWNRIRQNSLDMDGRRKKNIKRDLRADTQQQKPTRRGRGG